MKKARAYVGLGGNLGDARLAFDIAAARLAEEIDGPLARSRIYRTRPWGVVDQPEFLNAAVAFDSVLSPEVLLRLLLVIEEEGGRKRSGELHWGPRVLDLDLLLHGDAACRSGRLVLPHPRIQERDFVIAPLMDLGAPAPAGIAPKGWDTLMQAIPVMGRTIIAAEEWK